MTSKTRVDGGQSGTTMPAINGCGRLLNSLHGSGDRPFYRVLITTRTAVGQNPVPLMNIQIGGTWVFIRPKMEAWVMTLGHMALGIPQLTRVTTSRPRTRYSTAEEAQARGGKGGATAGQQVDRW